MPVQPLRPAQQVEQPKEDALDKIMKALGVAKGITGITSDFFNIKEAMANRELAKQKYELDRQKVLGREAIQSGSASPEQVQQQIGLGTVERAAGAPAEGRGIMQLLTEQPKSELSQRNMGTGLVQETLRDPETGKEVRKEETDLRKEFAAQTNKIGTPVVQVAYDKVRKAAENPSAANDLGLIFGYMKILDPGSTVREGEFANAEQSGGVPDRVRNLYNKMLSGERLNPSMREDFVRSAKTAFQGQMELQNRINQQYSEIAKNQGLDPKQVVQNVFSEGAKGQPKSAEKASPLKNMSDEELLRQIEMKKKMK